MVFHRHPNAPHPLMLSLTQRVSLPIFIRDSEHAHYLVTLLPQAGVYFLSKQALPNQRQSQLILVASLCAEDHITDMRRHEGIKPHFKNFEVILSR